MFRSWKIRRSTDEFDLDVLLTGIKSEVAVSPNHWALMYVPMFNCLVSFNRWFKGQDTTLVKQACTELPALIRRSKALVTDDIHEVHIKNFLTVSVYLSLKIASATSRYEVWVTREGGDVQVLPFLGATKSDDDFVVVRKRKRPWPSSIVASRAFHYITSQPNIAVWLYKFPDWLQVAYHELFNNGELGKIFDFGSVSFGDPFSVSLVAQIDTTNSVESQTIVTNPPTRPGQSLISSDDCSDTSILDLMESDVDSLSQSEPTFSSQQASDFEAFLDDRLDDSEQSEEVKT